MTRDIAALIPDARVRVIEGGWGDNIQDALDAIEEFLGGDEQRASVIKQPTIALTPRETEVLASCGRPQRQRDRTGADRQPIDRPAPHRQHLRQDRRARPSRGGRLRYRARAAFA